MYRVRTDSKPFANFLSTDHSVAPNITGNRGIDITNGIRNDIEGFVIFAQGPGVVLYRTLPEEPSPSAGHFIVVKYDCGHTARYLHLYTHSNRAAGTRVTASMSIGITGNTGESSAAHLHFDVNTGNYWDGNVINNNPQNVIKAIDMFPSGTFRRN
jgi:murein DD-endopeptidase MepM/ murein hydrolase activator NlpD